MPATPTLYLEDDFTPSDNTEQDMFVVTDPGWFEFNVNLTNVQTNDSPLFKVYKKLNSGGAWLRMYPEDFGTTAQSGNMWMMPITSNRYGLKLTIEQQAGTPRLYHYTVEQA
jgi:hypothetical protein